MNEPLPYTTMSAVDQPTALVLLRSEQITTWRYLELCRERGWDVQAGLSAAIRESK